MFHDVDQNRQHYDNVTTGKKPLYFQRFDTEILDNNPIVADLVAKAFQKMFPTPAGDMLDLGCGTGFYYPLLSQHARSIVGVDVSSEMLAEADRLIQDRGLSNCRVEEGSAMKLPLEDASMDVVHCWDFLHHVADIPQTLSEVERVLKPGGRFIAIEPNLMNPSITWYHARRRSEWRLFTQNQFTLPKHLRDRFVLSTNYDNTIISFLNPRTHWIWKAANAITSVKPLHLLSFRYTIDATKKVAVS
ncbi:class I SAM-dependent methyltransferase [Planctomycetes bacterium K23_9]|uniref:Putative methyltransferase YcgJ n=1 Tax=Stieleria marina TaxID=1930275 RepID=A0A517NU16_9BACT|nr:putative methyltransferase YcgJ [Planctomycetes bacterium K23_9]